MICDPYIANILMLNREIEKNDSKFVKPVKTWLILVTMSVLDATPRVKHLDLLVYRHFMRSQEVAVYADQ